MKINQDMDQNFILEQKLRKDLLSKPNNENLQYELCKILLKKQETKEEAKEILKGLLDSKMKNKVFFQLGKLGVEEGCFITARYYFKKLLNTKNRNIALFELGKLEKMSNNYDQAKKYFKEFLEEYDTDCRKEFYTLQQLLYLEIHSENYEQAYYIFERLLNYNEIKEIRQEHISQINLYLKYKLGKLEKMTDDYFLKQLHEYNEEEALKYIKSNLDENGIKRKNIIFLSSISLKKLYREVSLIIKILIPDSFALCDQYILDYEFAIGEINGKNVYTIKVITIPNTKNIIAMYPTLTKKIEFKTSEKKKVKKLDEI